jgi:hypothetical protein
MADFNVDLSPNLVNLGTEGSLDTSIQNGNSLQRKLTGVMVEIYGDRKIVGRIDDGGQFNETIERVKDYAGITKTTGDNYIFVNNDFVDYYEGSTETSDEANNLIAMFDESGVVYKKFTDIDGRTFSSLDNMDKLIIPELDADDLLPSLTSDARNAITDFVDGGGTLIMFEPNVGDVIDVLNELFGWSLNTSESEVSEPIAITEAGAILFPDESATLPDLSATDSLDTTTLPVNSVSIYTDDNDETIVAKMPYGDGFVYVLGWDWYDAQPVGDEDGGWNHLLRSILNS